MKKRLLLLLLAFPFFLGGCALTDPNLSASCSREDAIRLYNGDIAEAEWLERLDTISRPLPIPATSSVQLADGFLFYETELREGELRVVNVIPPADAPESLKQLAKSLRKNVPPAPPSNDLIVRITSDGFYLNGVRMSEEELCAALGKTAESSQKKNLVFDTSGQNVPAEQIQKFMRAFYRGCGSGE